MENPATWGNAEHVIDQAFRDLEEDLRAGTAVIGLSLTRRIADALRKADLLKDEAKPDAEIEP